MIMPQEFWPIEERVAFATNHMMKSDWSLFP